MVGGAKDSMKDSDWTARQTKLRAQFAPHRERLANALREPWYAEDEPGDFFESELALEVHPDHPLWGDTWLLIARRQDQDDFAFALSSGRIATVHLTFKGAREHGPWPGTTISDSLDTWLSEVAEEDSRDWEMDDD